MYTLVHNGTGEVIEASVQITVGDVRGGAATVIQKFGVTFNEVICILTEAVHSWKYIPSRSTHSRTGVIKF